MIELNLLPKEMRRKKRKVELPSIPFLQIAIGIVAFLIVCHILIVTLLFFRSGSLKRLKAEWETMQPQKKATDKVARETNELEKRIAAIRKIAKPDLSWTKLLSGLNQAMIPGIWFSNLQLEFKGKSYNPKTGGNPTALVLTGYALGKSEVGTASVARLINSLKRSKDFSGYFSEIELENMNAKKFEGEEAMFFRLECTFKQPPKKKAIEKKKGKRK